MYGNWKVSATTYEGGFFFLTWEVINWEKVSKTIPLVWRLLVSIDVTKRRILSTIAEHEAACRRWRLPSHVIIVILRIIRWQLQSIYFFSLTILLCLLLFLSHQPRIIYLVNFFYLISRFYNLYNFYSEFGRVFYNFVRNVFISHVTFQLPLALFTLLFITLSFSSLRTFLLSPYIL